MLQWTTLEASGRCTIWQAELMQHRPSKLRVCLRKTSKHVSSIGSKKKNLKYS